MQKTQNPTNVVAVGTAVTVAVVTAAAPSIVRATQRLMQIGQHLQPAEKQVFSKELKPEKSEPLPELNNNKLGEYGLEEIAPGIWQSRTAAQVRIESGYAAQGYGAMYPEVFDDSWRLSKNTEEKDTKAVVDPGVSARL